MGVVTKLPFEVAEYKARQHRFLSQIAKDCLVLIPTNPPAIRSNDVHYPYRASSYMLYLCGWSDPGSVFMAQHDGEEWKVSLFVQPKDTTAEIWEGRRIGVDGAAKGWPIDHANSLSDLEEIIEKSLRDSNGVYLIQKSNQQIDEIVNRSLTSKSRQRNTHGIGPTSIVDPSPILDEMRICKSPSEIEIMKKSAELAAEAHSIAMEKTHSQIGEWEIQAIVEGHFQSKGSQWSYPSIVGGGDNATILHYHANNTPVKDGDLILVDAGCEVDGYASDITRTWPANGKFTEAQKEIYNLVLKAEIAAIEACQIGSPWNSSHKASMEVISRGLIDLGILDCSLEEALGENFNGPYRNFFMHGTGHMLGLDVHDVGGGRQGDKGRTHLVSPSMAAAAAVKGHFYNIVDFINEK